MGLGKTLTTISLILKQTQRDDEKEEESEDSSDEENNNDGWKASGKKQLRDGGKLNEKSLKKFPFNLKFFTRKSRNLSCFIGKTVGS